MSIIDFIKGILGFGTASPAPGNPVRPPDPEPVAVAQAPVPPQAKPDVATPVVDDEPLARITLGNDTATVEYARRLFKRGVRQGSAPYRRPASIASGTYKVRREGNDLYLDRRAQRSIAVRPSEDAGPDDFGMAFYLYQSLLDAAAESGNGTVEIDDRYQAPEDDLIQDYAEAPVREPDSGASTQSEANALTTLGALGFETGVPGFRNDQGRETLSAGSEEPPVDPVPEQDGFGSVPPVPPSEPDAVTPAPEPDTWSPSGAYER